MDATTPATIRRRSAGRGVVRAPEALLGLLVLLLIL
jgi:hypothetical protein